MDAIIFAIERIQAAQRAFREHGLVSDEECRVCHRILTEGRPHAPDCAIDGLRQAARNLNIWLAHNPTSPD